MRTFLFFILILNIPIFASKNIFIIKDSEGNIVKNSRIKHTRNSFFDDLIEEQKKLIKGGDSNQNSLVQDAKRYLGGKYVWGGTKPTGFDCSGYVKYLYAKEGIELPRTAYQQSKVGRLVTRKELKKGDLLFFLTDKKRHLPITHVGMYIGDDKFIHAASKRKGIIISSFSKSKYNNYFVKAKRIIE